MTVLWLCCDCSLRFRQVLGFLKSAGADLSSARAGWTPLMLAASEGQVAATKFLLRRGVPWQGKNGRVSAAPSLVSPLVVNPRQAVRCQGRVPCRAVKIGVAGPFLCGGRLGSDLEHAV